MSDESALMTPGEVARLFRVDTRTVARWAKEGKLSSFKTIGGMRRFSRHEVMELIKETRTERIA